MTIALYPMTVTFSLKAENISEKIGKHKHLSIWHDKSSDTALIASNKHTVFPTLGCPGKNYF
jgi:hypothetical protein